MNQQSLNQQELALHDEALKLLEGKISASAFSEMYFGPQGRLQDLATSEAERKSLTQGALYQWLKSQYEQLRDREVEVFEKEVELLSGRVTITIPKSLHAALKGEARQEGISLSELMRMKLSVEYRQSVSRWLTNSKSKAKAKKSNSL